MGGVSHEGDAGDEGREALRVDGDLKIKTALGYWPQNCLSRTEGRN